MSQGGGRVNLRDYYVPKGIMLAQRYEVLDYLGEGGFSRTYIAGDILRPGKPRCVVKHLQPANPDPEFLQDAWRLFQQEAETLEKLGSHDQIPRLLAYFRDGQEFYLVQEFISGEPLSATLIEGRPWTEKQVYHLLVEVLTVLAFVHSHQVIHRDIKPDNLICRHTDRKLVLVDFGAVKQIRGSQVVTQNHTTFTISVGTLGYMPPEQFSGRPRPSSDIYALGVTAIQALTGLPLEAFKDDLETDESSWQRHVQVDPAIAKIITKMVQYRAIERYPSAAQALEDLACLNDLYKTEPDLVIAEFQVIEPQDSTTPTNQPDVQIESNDAILLTPEPHIPSAPEITVVSNQPELSTVEIQSLDSEHVTALKPLPEPSSQVIPAITPFAILPELLKSHRKPLIWVGSGIALCAIALLTPTMFKTQRPTSLPVPVEQAPSPNLLDLEQATFDEALSIARNGNLESAIRKVQTIPEASPMRARAQEQAFSWQATLIQTYLRSEVPTRDPKLTKLIEAIKPTVEKLNSEQITIRYDSSTHTDYSSDRGLRIITALFMERLRGNPKDNIASYKNLYFKQMNVFHMQSNQKAVLTLNDWDTYLKGNSDQETLFEKVQIVDRSK